MRVLLAALAILAADTAAAQNHCPESARYGSPDDEFSHELSLGNYEFGHTSAYRRTPMGEYEYIYCIRNLSNQTPFVFLWKGPDPRRLLEGRLGYGGDTTEGWQASSLAPADMDDRVLSIGRPNAMSDISVATLFRKAAIDRIPKVWRAQADDLPYRLDSWEGFVADLPNVVDREGRFSRVSGMSFSLPADVSQWERYAADPDFSPDGSWLRIRVSVGVEYSLETGRIDLVRSAGLAREGLDEETLTGALRRVRLVHDSLGETGFDAPEATDYEEIDTLVPLGGVTAQGQPYVGATRRQTIGSLDALATEQRAVRRVFAPIRVLIDGAPVAAFPLEILSAPEGL